MAEDDPNSAPTGRSWWYTLPGMLTAAAGFITAFTALIVTMTGLLGDSDEPSAANTRSAEIATRTTTTPTDTLRNPGELTLAVAVRATNNGDYDDNFWDRSFRLRVGGEKLAPVSSFSEVVPDDTSKDAVLEFGDRCPDRFIGLDGNARVKE